MQGMYDEPPPTVELFCQRFVEPMAEESDNLHIVALTDALQVSEEWSRHASVQMQVKLMVGGKAMGANGGSE